LLCGDHVSGGNKEYIATPNVSRVAYISSDGCKVPFGKLRDWKRGGYTSGGNQANGSTTYRFSVMGVLVGEVMCDSSVSDHANATFGGSHVDIASKTPLMRNWATDIYITYNGGWSRRRSTSPRFSS
jgi:hypothetical protein